MKLDAFGTAYLRLVLEIDKHVPGYIDAYLGPAELKESVAATTKREPASLAEDLAHLLEVLPTKDPARAAYLRGMLRAIDGTLRLLQGEDLGYLEEVNLLYDIDPVPVDEAVFVTAQNELDTLLPGSAPLAQRIEERRKAFELSPAQLMPLMQVARDEVRRRTAALIRLPEDETVDLAIVSDQPWGAYNWYQGNGRSLVEFNVDIPFPALGVLPVMAHEAYPGHHTEAILKEQLLWRDRGYAEQAAALLNSPSAVIAEGIATTAVEIVFPDDSQHQWNVDVLLPAAGMDHGVTADELARFSAAQRALRYASGNVAFLYHTGALDREGALEYVQSYSLASPERAAKSFSFFTNPLFRSYVYTYTSGYDLIAQAAGPDKTALFRRLLVEQVLPSELAAVVPGDTPL